MKILALETSAKSVSAAVWEDGAPLASCFQRAALTHSATLMPMIDAMLRHAALAPADLDAFAVAAGPGSFTGLRIGVSACKGMAWALGRPCAGVSTLEAMACNLASADALLICAMDARRGQIYNALFRAGHGAPERLTPDRAIALGDLCAELRGRAERLLVLGDGAELCQAYLSEQGIACALAPAELRFQNALGVARAADAAFARGEGVTAAALRPVYLRPSQAERERAAKLGMEKISNTKI